MKKVCNNGYKNYIKSRPGASKDSARRAKNIDTEKMRNHPVFAKICNSESKKFEFINKMKNYKPKMVRVFIQIFKHIGQFLTIFYIFSDDI